MRGETIKLTDVILYTMYQTTKQYFPRDSGLQSHRRENPIQDIRFLSLCMFINIVLWQL